MKQILSYVVLCVLILSNIGLTKADFTLINPDQQTKNEISLIEKKAINQAKKSIILQGGNLQKTMRGKKYKHVIDTFTSQASKEKLQKVKKRTSYILSTTNYTGEVDTIIQYLDAKITVALYTGAFPPVPLQTLTESEKNATNKAIMDLQKNIFNTLSEVTRNIETSVKNTSNVSESGAFNIDIEANHESFGHVQYQIETNDYETHQNGLDALGKTGDMNVLFNMKNPDGEEIKLDLLTNLETIQKDGDMYVLFKKFIVQDQKGVEEVNSFSHKLQTLITENKYIKINDANSTQVYKMFQELTNEGFIKQFHTVTTTQMLDIKGKKDNKYVVVPNKNFCEFIYSFRNLGNNNCDTFEKQVAKELQKTPLFLELLDNNTYKLSLEGVDNGTHVNLSAVYSATELSKIDIKITPNIQGAGLSVSYLKNKDFTFNFVDPSTGTMHITAKLDNHNHITSADLDFHFGKTKITGNYKNKHLSLGIIADTYYSKMDGKVELDFTNTIPTNGFIHFTVSSKDFYTKEMKNTLTSKITIKNKNISGTTTLPELMTITHSGSIDTNIFRLNNTIDFSSKAEEQFIAKTQAKSAELNGHLNIDIDTRVNKNNIFIEGKLKNGNKTILSALIKNISKKEYNTSIQITKPEKVINMQEFISDFYSY